MQDWIVNVVEDLAERRKRKAIEDELQLYRTRSLEMKWNDAWMDLRAQVQLDVKRYTRLRQAGDPEISYEELTFGFAVTTLFFPRISLTAKLPDGALHIEYTHVAKFNERKSWKRRLELKLEERGECYLECAGERFDAIIDVAQFLLRPLIDADFRPPSDAA